MGMSSVTSASFFYFPVALTLFLGEAQNAFVSQSAAPLYVSTHDAPPSGSNPDALAEDVQLTLVCRRRGDKGLVGVQRAVGLSTSVPDLET